MAYEFYYDKVLSNKNLTFRLIGQKYHEREGEDIYKLDLGEAQVILRDVIKTPLQIAIDHGYAYGGGDLTNIAQNYNTSIAQWKLNWEAFKTRFENIFGQVNGEWARSPAEFIQIVNGSDYYKVFTGTDVQIPFSFECRLYTRKNYDSEDNNNKYETPIDQLKRINDFFLGVSGREDPKSNPGMFKRETEGGQVETRNTYKWYSAPHGYQGLASDNFTPLGTLSLFYGRTAVVDNLLLKNYNFSYSKELLYQGGEAKGPLYIDLSFSLIPATIFTVEDIQSIVTTNAGEVNSRRSGSEGSTNSNFGWW